MIASRAAAGPRRSGGGTVVEVSLRNAGFTTGTNQISLVETAAPTSRPFAKVLVQNAWTALPALDYEVLSAPYPRAWKVRMAARRAVAALNIHRAEQVVCLTETMGALVRRMTRTPVLVAPVVAPYDVSFSSSAHFVDPAHAATVVVPGTITWYKRPQLALQIAKCLGDQLDVTPTVLFAGREDGSGAWAAVQDEGRRVGIPVTRAHLSRDRMMIALRSSLATILPSELESLSLSLSEALLTSPRVVASSLAVHREVSDLLDRTPEWVETWQPHPVPATQPSEIDPERIRASWRRAGTALSLSPLTEEGKSA